MSDDASPGEEALVFEVADYGDAHHAITAYRENGVATDDNSAAALGARLLSLVDAKIAAGAPIPETVAEIRRQADMAIADGVGVSALDPKAYQLTQIALLTTQVHALRRLAELTGDACIIRYADILGTMYGKLAGDVEGGGPKATPFSALLPLLNELSEIRRELGIPDQQ